MRRGRVVMLIVGMLMAFSLPAWALSVEQYLSGALDKTNGRLRLKLEAYDSTANTSYLEQEQVYGSIWDSTANALTVALAGATANGQLLIGNASTGAYTQATLTAGSGMSITNSAGGITLASSALYPSDAGDGVIYIGQNTGAFAAANITGTSNQVTVTNGTNSITLSTPQNIHTAATPRFARMGLGVAADGTKEIILSNSETIDNTVNGTIQVTATTFATSGGVDFGGDIVLQNDESITNAVNGTLQLTAPTVALSALTVAIPMGTTGGVNLKVSETTTGALSGASGSCAVNVPSGAILVGSQLRVDTLIASGDGATSWAAAYATGATQSIATGQAFTKSTKVNKFFDANAATAITSGTTTITITPNSGTFSAGVVRCLTYYMDFTAAADAP